MRRMSLFVLLAAALIGSAGYANAQTSPSTYDQIKKSGVLRAGVKFDFPPVGSVDLDGKPMGFGPDLAKMIADELGVKVEYTQTTSQNRIPMLESDRIDAEFGASTPTIKREEVVDFTIPYVWDTVNLLVPKGQTGNLDAYAPPKKIATAQGSFVVDIVKQLMPNADLVLLQEYTDAVVALKNRKVDAVGVNGFLGAAFETKNPDLELGKPFFTDPWAIMVRQNDSKWRNFLNWTLQKLWNEGRYQALYEKHFGAPPAFHMWSEFRLQPGIEN